MNRFRTSYKTPIRLLTQLMGLVLRQPREHRFAVSDYGVRC
jgi:hypothetical protein